MQFEVEQKFRVEDLQAVEQRLRALSARQAGRVEQVDQYFNHPARDFAKTDEALRLRQVGEENFITYKGPKLDATTKTRREIELPLAPDKPALGKYAELLVALGFRPAGEVRKTRRKWQVNWDGREIEVVLDDVAGLDTFVELELTADENAIATAKTAIASLAEKLGLRENERRSYLELLLSKSLVNKKPPAETGG